MRSIALHLFDHRSESEIGTADCRFGDFALTILIEASGGRSTHEMGETRKNVCDIVSKISGGKYCWTFSGGLAYPRFTHPFTSNLKKHNGRSSDLPLPDRCKRVGGTDDTSVVYRQKGRDIRCLR